MSMFTACPNCKLQLAVSAADLRVGQGYVRCGRCDRVFNALLSLGEDPEREQEAQGLRPPAPRRCPRWIRRTMPS